MGVGCLELCPPLMHVLTPMACQMPALCWAGVCQRMRDPQRGQRPQEPLNPGSLVAAGKWQADQAHRQVWLAPRVPLELCVCLFLFLGGGVNLLPPFKILEAFVLKIQTPGFSGKHLATVGPSVGVARGLLCIVVSQGTPMQCL